MSFSNEIFEQIRKRMQDREIFGEQEYYDTMDEVLDEYQDLQLITDDDDTEIIREDLRERWKELEGENPYV